MPDATDRRILRQLLADPGIANPDLAERAGVTPASLWRRLERMRETGVIRAIESRIDWRKLGYEVQVSLRFTLDKTDPRAYALGPKTLGLPAKQILFVSSNGWDALGATWFGFTTLWVNRAGAPLETLGTEPTRVGASLRDVLNFFPS